LQGLGSTGYKLVACGRHGTKTYQYVLMIAAVQNALLYISAGHAW